ncbi:NlpC/P60 family protein [Anaeromusa sp.]|uniref:C40 family peptidase n=1 Tax=Anaeromusa sp. TaxID=1872520 RepID=UPI00261B25EF|nr:NlpC/P60 family protein [Anaeromusa sp.]MDD3157511.1 NlpC/P60 family protein [Anaeromusa sp.]
MGQLKRFFVLGMVCFLLSAPGVADASSIREGDIGDDVTAIQQRLQELGFGNSSADGDFGSATRAAVMAFQKANGLEADGIVGSGTYRALMGRDIPVSRSDMGTSMTRRIIQSAMSFRGVPYVFGGTTPYGFDCSGFTRYVFANAGIFLPRMADEQYDAGYSVSNPQPGDLVFFTTYTSGVSHVGIYIGDDRFISATSSRGVRVDSLYDGYWGARYLGAKRVM